jgi:nucleotide-binding universal stress UspA family protein
MNGILEQLAPNEAILGASDVNVQRIVVAVDLFEHSKKTASYAIALGKSFGASITFVHVFPAETNREFTTEDIHRRYERERDTAQDRLASFGDKMRQIYPRSETEFRIGDTAEQVQLVAFNLKADLIITASYHPGFLGHLLGLEQARRIVTHAPCVVLVLHEPEE